MTTMMTCGHAANAKVAGQPACAICSCYTVVHVPDAEFAGRTATCGYCRKVAKSEDRRLLAFFEHRPDKDTDTYYCGCRGWD